jgi:hypothetical protein
MTAVFAILLLFIINIIYLSGSIDSDYKFFSCEFMDAKSSSRRLSSIQYDMSQQTKEEENYLKFHRCNNEGEVYAAAYLITKEHLLQHSISANLSEVNTELASFIMFNTRASKNEIRPGTMTQSLDILDFSVIHLSAFERLIRRHRIKQEQKYLDSMIISLFHLATKSPYRNKLMEDRRLNETVAIMPFLGSEVGVGNSKITHRLNYLKATFWSLYRYIPHIVVGVKHAADVELVK